MKPYKTLAHINSLRGEEREITVLDIRTNGNHTEYIVDYNKTLCTAILNPFNWHYYADDIYGKIKDIF
jgi:hypothetical protein